MDTKQPANFEKALDRLETVVSEMEGGELSLDKMMKHFEEGMGLVSFCGAKLNEVERKIERLVQKEDGRTTTEPFEPPQAESAEPEGEAPDVKKPQAQGGDDLPF